MARRCLINVIIKQEKPPVWENVLALFKINVSTTLFTYGDTLYNPSGLYIPPDYMQHEEHHSGQQGHNDEGAGKWWARYFQDPYFRVDQEAEAYGIQYAWWLINGPASLRNNREMRYRKLLELAQKLAGPMYGDVINLEGAKKLIKQHAGL